MLNRYNIPYGHTSYGITAVTGRGGPFATGDSLNQWIQQVAKNESLALAGISETVPLMTGTYVEHK